MKNIALKSIFTLLFTTLVGIAFAQKDYFRGYDNIQFFRHYDQRGINVFENLKKDSIAYDGFRVRVGGGFTQQFQSLTHENRADVVNINVGNPAVARNRNELVPITSGFNTANANLNFDVQLADGIRLNLTTYLSSRHHNETWVKGGYIQFDKLPFKGKLFDDIMKYATIKVGHMEINYGDAHFRRSDGGQTIYNPFVENYILDAFTTEIGGEVYFQHPSGILAMLGVSNGEIKGSIDQLTPTSTDPNAKKSPAIYGKLGFDNNAARENFRIRLTGSFYNDNSSQSNTLFWGDRTGSNYFQVMESNVANPTAFPRVAANAKDQAWSGRVNPQFNDKVNSMMFNALVKYMGLEIFGTFETAKGRTAAESAERKVNQLATDLIYRFGANENVFLGVRYNQMKGRLLGQTQDVTVDRFAIGGGWFLTKNILLKGEYVNQNYKDFAPTDIRANGKFNGYVIEAVVGF
jgi:hypothetical protein